MGNFFKLCVNELVKILKKKSIYIFFIIILIVLFLNVLYTDYYEYSWWAGAQNTLKNDKAERIMLEKIELQIKEIEEVKNHINREAINGVKSLAFVVRYAVNNNISLYESEFWKGDILTSKILPLKTKMYNYESGKDISVNEIDKVTEEYNYYMDMMETDNYDAYIDYKIKECEKEYRNGIIDEDTQNIEIYMLEVEKKYEISKYDASTNFWKYKAKNEIKRAITTLIREDITLSVEERNELNEKIDLASYKIGNNIANNDEEVINFNDYYIEAAKILTLSILTIYIIITACTSISSEFSKGTIKELVTSPNKRWKVILAKIVTIAILMVIISVILSLLSQLFGSAFFGDYSASKYVYYSQGQIMTIDGFVYNILKFLVIDIQIFMYMLISITIATLISKTAISVSLSVFIYSSTSIFLEYFNSIVNKEWLKFIPFNNFNLTHKIFSKGADDINIYNWAPIHNEIVSSVDLKFSIIVILICAALLLITAIDSFRKKEI